MGPGAASRAPAAGTRSSPEAKRPSSAPRSMPSSGRATSSGSRRRAGAATERRRDAESGEASTGSSQKRASRGVHFRKEGTMKKRNFVVMFLLPAGALVIGLAGSVTATLTAQTTSDLAAISMPVRGVWMHPGFFGNEKAK